MAACVLRLNKGLRSGFSGELRCLSYLVTKSKIMGRPDFLLAIAYCSFGDWGPGAGLYFFSFAEDGDGDVG